MLELRLGQLGWKELNRRGEGLIPWDAERGTKRDSGVEKKDVPDGHGLVETPVDSWTAVISRRIG